MNQSHRAIGVLVVEDEMIVAALIEDVLTDAGYYVLGPFHSSTQALQSLATFRPDAALLDVRLARGTSIDVADELERRNIPFILVSGSAQASLPSRHRNRPFLAKPVGTSELVGLVEALVCRTDAAAD